MAAGPVEASVLRARFRNQLLTGPGGRSVAEVARTLLATQAQDEMGFRLTIRPRCKGITVADVEAALSDERSVIVTWANRGTLQLIPAEDYAWLHSLTAPTIINRNLWRLDQEGVAPEQTDKAVKLIVETLTRNGPQTRQQLRDVLDAAGLPVAGQAGIHLFMRTCLLGHAVRGPMVGRNHAYVLVHDWLGEHATLAKSMDRDRCLAEFARRFLRGHGPATDRDLAKWSGMPLGDARRGLAQITDELCDWGDGLVDLQPSPKAQANRVRAAAAGLPPPRVLGAFEPVLLGWTSRQPIVGEHLSLVTVNGLFRPFLMVDGKAVGTWSRSGTHATLQPFGLLDPSVTTALEADAADVERFLTAS